jgi:hypothetical protein
MLFLFEDGVCTGVCLCVLGGGACILCSGAKAEKAEADVYGKSGDGVASADPYTFVLFTDKIVKVRCCSQLPCGSLLLVLSGFFVSTRGWR